MRRLLVRLLAAVLVCEGVVLSLLPAAFFILGRVLFGPVRDPAPLWVRAVQGAVIALWVVVVWAGAHALWTGRYRAERVWRRLLSRSSAGISSCPLRCPCGSVARPSTGETVRRRWCSGCWGWRAGRRCTSRRRDPRSPAAQAVVINPNPQTDRH
jgi:hypothetical protein